MGIVRKTIAEVLASEPNVDWAKVDATTEEDIRRYQIEDGYDPDYEPDHVEFVCPPKSVRERAGFSQEAFAAALRVPLATVQDWESAGFAPDPAARSLLRLVAKEPALIIRLLAA